MSLERSSLLPKGPDPNGSTSDTRTIENYQSRQNVYVQPSYNGYEAIPTTPPMIIQGGGLFTGQTYVPVDEINLQGESSSKVPSDYSGIAWLSVLFCCFPLSIAAIYKSNKVMKSIRRGDITEAWVHSIAAKKLSSLAIIYGIMLIVIAIVLYLVISTQVTHTLDL